jgi:hypothetical protein
VTFVPVQRPAATAPRGLSAAPKWSIGLTALVGAWLGHFFEYARVAGWHAGISAMADAPHIYFFPAGAALIAVVLAFGAGATRTWHLLGDRLRRAQAGLWVRPERPLDLADPVAAVRPGVSLPALWALLTVLQLSTWILQENLETVSSGHPAPWLGVIGGTHWLAPLIQAEVALILATTYVVVHRLFSRRRAQVEVIERLVARKWRRRCSAHLTPLRSQSVAWSPLARWGAQRWQRPPPARLSSRYT